MGDDYFDPELMEFPMRKEEMANFQPVKLVKKKRNKSKESQDIMPQTNQNHLLKQAQGLGMSLSATIGDFSNLSFKSQSKNSSITSTSKSSNSQYSKKSSGLSSEGSERSKKSGSSSSKSRSRKDNKDKNKKDKPEFRGSYWNLPRIYFYAPTKPYHPHIDPTTGELNLSWYFKTWDEKRHHVWHCLKLLKHIFYNKMGHNDLYFTRSTSNSSNYSNYSSKSVKSSKMSHSKSENFSNMQQNKKPLPEIHFDGIPEENHENENPPPQKFSNLFNESAARLYVEKPNDYQKMVQLNISQTKIELNTAPTLTNDLFEPDYSDIPDAEVFLVQKNKMMSAGEKQKLTGWQAQNAQTSGHSFIMPGTIRPFSKK